MRELLAAIWTIKCKLTFIFKSSKMLIFFFGIWCLAYIIYTFVHPTLGAFKTTAYTYQRKRKTLFLVYILYTFVHSTLGVFNTTAFTYQKKKRMLLIVGSCTLCWKVKMAEKREKKKTREEFSEPPFMCIKGKPFSPDDENFHGQEHMYGVVSRMGTMPYG